MEALYPVTKTFSLKHYGIANSRMHYQLSPEELREKIIENNQGQITNSNAMAINTGEFTGRSPMDRFIVRDQITKDKVWWGDVNLPFDKEAFDALYKKVTTYLSGKDVFV